MRGFLLLLLLGIAARVGAQDLTILRDVPSTYVYPVAGFLPFNIHRGIQTLLSLMLNGATFNDPQGVACALLKSDHDPKDPKQDVVVTMVGVNSGAGEIIYNVGLKDIRRLGTEGHGKDQFFHPMGVAINSDGEVAVADAGNDRVVLLKHDGLRLKWYKVLGASGTGLGRFKHPMAVAYDSQDNLYIADSGNDRVQVRDVSGHFHQLPLVDLQGPSALAVIDGKEPWVFYHDGAWANRLAVVDHMGARLRVFSLEGRQLAQVTSDQLADGPMQLTGCAFDYYGNVVATDMSKGCLRKFDLDLHPLVTFGSPGTGDFQFTEPRGIAFNRQFGQMLVSEKDSVQYFWNGVDVLNPQATAQGTVEKFSFFLTEKGLVTATIETPDGKAVSPLAQAKEMEQGAEQLEWEPGADIAPGPYQLRLRLMATYSSRERVAKEMVFSFNWAR